MTETQPRPRKCPVCMKQTLVTHCDNNPTTCPWHRCTNTDCDAQLNLATGRGHSRLTPGKQERRLITLGKEKT